MSDDLIWTTVIGCCACLNDMYVLNSVPSDRRIVYRWKHSWFRYDKPVLSTYLQVWCVITTSNEEIGLLAINISFRYLIVDFSSFLWFLIGYHWLLPWWYNLNHYANHLQADSKDHVSTYTNFCVLCSKWYVLWNRPSTPYQWRNRTRICEQSCGAFSAN